MFGVGEFGVLGALGTYLTLVFAFAPVRIAGRHVVGGSAWGSGVIRSRQPDQLLLSGYFPPLFVGRRKSTEKVCRQKGFVSALSQLTNLYVEPSHPL
jgi:hypothetical protein